MYVNPDFEPRPRLFQVRYTPEKRKPFKVFYNVIETVDSFLNDPQKETLELPIEKHYNERRDQTQFFMPEKRSISQGQDARDLECRSQMFVGDKDGHKPSAVATRSPLVITVFNERFKESTNLPIATQEIRKGDVVCFSYKTMSGDDAVYVFLRFVDVDNNYNMLSLFPSSIARRIIEDRIIDSNIVMGQFELIDTVSLSQLKKEEENEEQKKHYFRMIGFANDIFENRYLAGYHKHVQLLKKNEPLRANEDAEKDVRDVEDPNDFLSHIVSGLKGYVQQLARDKENGTQTLVDPQIGFNHKAFGHLTFQTQENGEVINLTVDLTISLNRVLTVKTQLRVPKDETGRHETPKFTGMENFYPYRRNLLGHINRLYDEINKDPQTYEEPVTVSISVIP